MEDMEEDFFIPSTQGVPDYCFWWNYARIMEDMAGLVRGFYFVPSTQITVFKLGYCD